MQSHRIISLLTSALLMSLCFSHTVTDGNISLEVVTGAQSQEYSTPLFKEVAQKIVLTQSSKIKIQVKISLSGQRFEPQFVSFRLRHPLYNNITEPVLAQWEQNDQIFYATIDLGDPKHIKPLSGEYKLDVIISDDRLETQVRRSIAKCQVNFRFSLERPPSSQLFYKVPSTIMTQAPAERVDPPPVFTGFVSLVLAGLFLVFLWGLSYQGVNFKLFPKDGLGLILNFIWLGLAGAVVYVLSQFWLKWTFICTVQVLLVVLVPFSLVANYAFLHVKKQ